MSRYNIDTELGVDWCDEGPWRSFRLSAAGNTPMELIDDAVVEAVDQDGGTIDCYGIGEYSSEVEAASLREISAVTGLPQEDLVPLLLWL